MGASVWGHYVSASTAFNVKTMCAIKGIQHPLGGHWFSAQKVFECWGFVHKRHPFWRPLDTHKMGHPTAITCKIITNLDLHFACEATRTRLFFQNDIVHTLLDGREIILMIQVCKSFRMVATLVPKPDQAQKFVWPLCVTPIFQGIPLHAHAKGTVPLLRRTSDAPRHCRASG